MAITGLGLEITGLGSGITGLGLGSGVTGQDQGSQAWGAGFAWISDERVGIGISETSLFEELLIEFAQSLFPPQRQVFLTFIDAVVDHRLVRFHCHLRRLLLMRCRLGRSHFLLVGQGLLQADWYWPKAGPCIPVVCSKVVQRLSKGDHNLVAGDHWIFYYAGRLCSVVHFPLANLWFRDSRFDIGRCGFLSQDADWFLHYKNDGS